MSYFIIFYLSCALLLLITFTFFYRNDDLEFDKESVVIMLFMTVFSPFGVVMLLGVALYDIVERRQRRVCHYILHKWEKKAQEGISEWSWYSLPVNAEARCERMRETVYCLSDNELNMIVSMNQNNYKLDKIIVEAAMDEIIYRKLI